MNVRRATCEDVESIRQLVSHAYGKYVERIGRKPKPMLADYLAAVEEHQLWVAHDRELLEGILELIARDDHLLIENIAVAPKRQRSGIGKALLQFAEQEARRQNFGELRLYTNARFTENLAIYAKVGFHETRRERIGPTEVVHMSKLVK
jgi:GNAT superfamily N-acetyltransferase